MGFERILRRLLEYGVLAPSIYNSQPWKFSIDPKLGMIEVYPDKERAGPETLDPRRRDLYLALGACVEHMVLAAPALGYEIKEELFPDKGRSELTARLVLKALPEAVPETLFSALLTRQSHAGEYKEGSVGETHLDRLRSLQPFSTQEKIYLMTEEVDRQKLIQLLHDISHDGSGIKQMVDEGARWISPRSDGLEGLPMAHLGLPISVKVRFKALRYFGYSREIREVARQALLRQGHGIGAPAYLLMTTQNAAPQGYFNAGKWHARLALTLSEMELGSQTLHLPVFLESSHAALRQMFNAAASEEPVLLLRFGQPEKKSWPKTSRRPPDQCFLKADRE
jgi:hypothetical protein